MNLLCAQLLAALTAAAVAQAGDLERGIALAESGRCAEALELLDVGLAASPEDVVGLRWRGHCRNLLGRYPAALADYDRALALDDSDSWTHYARAMSLHNLGRYSEAVEGYGAALERSPDYVKALQWRAHTHALMEAFTASLPDYDRALELMPGDGWTLVSRARARARLRDFRGAAQDFDRATTIWPDDAGTFLLLGLSRALEGNPRARGALGRALALDPDGQGHAALWKYWVDGDRERGRRDLETWREGRSGWAPRLADLLLGRADGASLEVMLLAQPAEEREGMACERDFFEALARRRDGDSAGALEALRAALARPTRAKWEWEAARVELASLAGGLGLTPSLDFGFDAEGRVTTVGAVAAGAGLAVGDRVVDPAPLDLLPRAWSAALGGLVAVTVERDGTSLEFELVVVAGS